MVIGIFKVLFYIIGLLPSKNIVVFESFLGKQYSDNPRAIYEVLQKKEDFNCKIYWSVDKRFINSIKSENINVISRFSLKWIFIMARAKYWVTNSRLPLWIPKPKHTTYIQTWHGTPLKKLGVDIEEVHMPGTNTEKYKQNFLKEASKWDYLISPNAYSTEIFKRAFGFNKKIIETGYPRNDYLVNENNWETILHIKQKNFLPNDKKIILYAPTWRDNQFYKVGNYQFNLQLDLAMLKEAIGDEYMIILRLHYLVAEKLDLTGYEDFVVDFSHYEDIRDLYLISDILVTDYSSVFFDFVNLKRPIIFFVYDIEEYKEKLRGFYFDFENKAPGPLVKTNVELISEIKKAGSASYIDSNLFQDFYDKFCYLEDGCASNRVIDNVFER